MNENTEVKRWTAKRKATLVKEIIERWATDLTRVWCEQTDRWITLSAVIDCHTRELLSWRLSRRGNANMLKRPLRMH